jgi:hypothetical protein
MRIKSSGRRSALCVSGVRDMIIRCAATMTAGLPGTSLYSA